MLASTSSLKVSGSFTNDPKLPPNGVQVRAGPARRQAYERFEANFLLLCQDLGV